jgi:hypothetical protein
MTNPSADLVELAEDLEHMAYLSGFRSGERAGPEDQSRADNALKDARLGILSAIKRVVAKRERADDKERRRFERATKLSRAELKRLVAAAQRAVESNLPEDEPDYTAKWVYEEAIQLAWRSAIIAAMAGQQRHACDTCDDTGVAFYQGATGECEMPCPRCRCEAPQ